MSDKNCPECGAELTEDASYCRECGVQVVTKQSDSHESPSETESGDVSSGISKETKDVAFFEWAYGFKPGATFRNLYVAGIYLVGGVFTFGILPAIVLFHAYRSRNSRETYNTESTGGGQTEQRSAFDSIPGIDSKNSTRRNVLVVSGYVLGGFTTIGILSYEENGNDGESEGGGGNGNDGDSEGGGGESDGRSSDATTGFGDGNGVEQVAELSNGSYSDMDISGDGRSMVTGSSFDAVRLHFASGNSREIAEIANIPDVLISEAGDSIIATDHGTFTNYNTDGEQQWEQTIEDTDGSELEIGGIDATPDFEFVGVGTEAFIGAIGEDGDSLWEDSLPAGRVWEVKVSESGEYVAVRTENRDDNPAHENAVHLYDNSGEHLWSKTYDVPPLRMDVSESSGIVTVGLDDVRLLVYNLDGELQWEESGFGGYFELSDNGEWILAQDIENTVVFTPEGEEVWRYEMPDSEYGLWLYDRMDVSNSGRSIGSYENITEENSTVNMYDEGGVVIWQSDYDAEDVSVCLSEDGSTWMVSTRDQIEVYHDYDLAE